VSEKERRVMSLLGHKRTFAVQKGMSALHPIADICSAQAHVRFVPKADMLGFGLVMFPMAPFYRLIRSAKVRVGIAKATIASQHIRPALFN
jgi:hypothetical protein